MGYPRLDVHLDTIRNNARVVSRLCAEHGITVTGVTKAFAGEPKIARAFTDAGILRLGDSRIKNLKKLADFKAEKWLIRMPMLSEAAETVRYADLSLNSEWEVIKALSAAATVQGKVHQVILMADLGDLREGFVDYDELLSVAEQAAKLPNIRLCGVGTNLSCFSFIHPDTEKMTTLAKLAERMPIEGPPIVSGGNSANLYLMMQGGVPEGVNNFRLGESLLFGKERCHYTFLEGTRRDAFVLSAEVIERKDKPTVPWGEAGVDSYGRAPKRRADKGIRRKAILALGKQDCDIETMRPVDDRIEILGASSDHLMLDISDSEKEYRVGDTVEFELGYFALMRAFTSGYVEKNYIG